MKKVLAVLVAAGVMGGMGMLFAAPAEAHGCCVRYVKPAPCCVNYRAVRYYKPVDRLVRKVSYERVTSYRTVLVKKAYRDCCCRRFYRTVAYQQPVEKMVRKVSYERVTYYKPYTVVKAYRRRCCGWW